MPTVSGLVCVACGPSIGTLLDEQTFINHMTANPTHFAVIAYWLVT